MSKYQRVREQGITFVFKMDDADETLLHIFARHLTTIDDALDVWFDTGAGQTWNVRHQRYERLSGTHGLYWIWLEPERVVMVITCFTLKE